MDPLNAGFARAAYKAWSEFDPPGHIRELSRSGGNVDIDSSISPTRYIRAMNQMEKTSHYYLKEGKHEQAYVLLNKLVTIFVEKLPSHPAYKTLDSKSRAEGNRIVKRAFPIAEDLKHKLTQKYVSMKETSMKELVQQLECTDKSSPIQTDTPVSQDTEPALQVDTTSKQARQVIQSVWIVV